MDASARSSRRRAGINPWLLRALVAFLAFALASILAEMVLRRGAPASPVRRVDASGMNAYDPLLGWSLAPGTRTRQRSREYDVAVRVNADGFRADREYAPRPPPGTLRVVAIGDSFTFGQGVEIEEAWPSLLERGLGGAEVINLGVPGYGVDQQLLMLESRGLRFHPDVVVLGLHTPDIFRNTAAFHNGYGKPVFRLDGSGLRLTNVPAPPPGSPPPPPRGGLLGRSRLYQMASLRLERHGFGEVWDVTERILRRMARVAEKADARLIVLLLPPQHAVHGNALERRSQARTTGRIAALLREIRIEHLDLTPALAGAAERNPGERLFYPGDGHFTAAGHRVVAQQTAGIGLLARRAVGSSIPSSLQGPWPQAGAGPSDTLPPLPWPGLFFISPPSSACSGSSPDAGETGGRRRQASQCGT